MIPIRYFTFIFLIFAVQIFVTENLYSQKSDKTIELESALIDAVREEQTGFPEKAIDILQKIKNEPEVKAIAQYQLAKLYAATGKLDEAIIASEESVKADPSNKWFLVLKANLLEKTGRNLQVAMTYQELVKLEPNQYTFYENAALYWMKSDQADKALTILQQAHQKFGPLPALILRKVDLLMIQNKPKQAIDALNQSIEVYPKHSELYLALADIYAHQKKDIEFQATLDRLKAKIPDHPFLKKMENKPSNNETSSSFAQKIQSGEWNLDQAIAYLIPEVEKVNAETQEVVIQELLNKSDILINKYSQNPKPYVLTADIYFNANRLSEALPFYLKASTFNQIPYQVWDHLLYVLSHQNHWKSLEENASKVLDIYPNQSYPYFTLAESLYKLNRGEEALKNIQQYLLMQRKSETARAAAYILQAKIYKQLNNDEAENASWAEAMKINSPSNPAMIENTLVKIKDGEKISSSDLLTAFKSEQIPNYYKDLKMAEIKMMQNQLDEAKNLILSAFNDRMNHTSENYLLAIDIFSKLKDKEKVKEYAQKGIQLAEDKSPFEKILKQAN
ncbi:MAG: tetratricopeptide repeat protein [Saprospiraceae bacterium]|nr:tetratricopeptide repeat protein [Saprospiraceae bacterium]MBK9630480.1 tetratricopeptide repeat protein [Saprospiraceae bacterium]